MTTDESREYLVKFMEKHFTDRTYHRYIRGERGSVNLAGDFAWQMARALRMLEAASGPGAPEALDADEMARLRRLIHALGMDGSMNASDEQVRGLLFTALGQAAGKLESAPGTPEAPKPPFPISDDEMAALRRFWECATDGEGYDVDKSMMQRLAEMGLVQRKSGAYYMSTDFGLYVLGEYTIQRAAQLDGGQEGSAT